MGSRTKTRQRPIGGGAPITRKQQMAALGAVKAQQVAAAVGADIRDAVKIAVEEELGKIKSTMFDLIDRVVELETKLGPLHDHWTASKFADAYMGEEEPSEGDSSEGQEREEATEVSHHDEMVPGPAGEGDQHSGEDEEGGPASG